MQEKYPQSSIMEDDASASVPVSEPAASGTSAGAVAAVATGNSAGAAAGAGAGNGYVPKRSPTQVGVEGNFPPIKSNSVYIDAAGNETPIRHSQRMYLDGGQVPNVWKWTDGFKIAVFSQEASRNFSTRYWNAGIRYESFDGSAPEALAPNVRDTLASKVEAYRNVKTYAEALTKLFHNRETPHVVAVIEGQRDNLLNTFTLTSSPAVNAAATAASSAETAASFTLRSFYIQGTNRLGSLDNKQSMHFYVRDDMEKAVTLVETEITSHFTVGEIQFSTANNKYSIYVPHIPNNIAKNAVNAHSLLEKQAKASDRIVIGYMGDTNFKSRIQEYSSPSTGGLQGSIFLSPASSSAKKFTVFMQGVSFGPDKDYSFRMQQPTVLNHVELQLGANDKTATDHPSIQTTILLDSDIINRDYSNVAVHPYLLQNLQVKNSPSAATATAAAVDPDAETVVYSDDEHDFDEPSTFPGSSQYSQPQMYSYPHFQSATLLAGAASPKPVQQHAQPLPPSVGASPLKPVQHHPQPLPPSVGASPLKPAQQHPQPLPPSVGASPLKPAQQHSQHLSPPMGATPPKPRTTASATPAFWSS